MVLTPFAAITHDDVAFVISGGFSTITDSWVRDKSPENCISSVEIYDPELNTWSHGPDLPSVLCAMGVVKYYGTIYVLGESVVMVVSILYVKSWAHRILDFFV